MPTSPRLVTLATVTLSALAAGPALADEGPPGMCECAAPAPAPVVVARHEGWDGRKLAIGLRVTSMGLAPESSEDPEDQQHFGGGGLVVRYRFNPRWEVELIGETLREHREDGTESDLMLSSGTIGARYHITPYRKWDFYALLGLGSTQAVSHETEEEIGEPLGHVHLGGGVERRFGRLGLAAELRIVGMAPEQTEDGDQAVPANSEPRMSIVGDDEGLSGGSLSLAATYHF